MKKTLYSLAFCFCLLAMQVAQAQETILFKPNKGYAFNGLLTMKNKISMGDDNKTNSDMQFFVRVEVIDVAADGIVKLTMVTTRATMTMVAPNKEGKASNLTYDTQNPTKVTEEKMQNITQGLDNIVGKKATLTIQPDGKVIKTEGLPEEAAQLGKYFEGIIVSLPSKPVKVGDSWEQSIEDNSNGMPTTTTMKHTVTELTAQELKYTTKGDMEMMGMSNKDVLNSTTTVEKTTGMVKISHSTFNYSMDMGVMKMSFYVESTFERVK